MRKIICIIPSRYQSTRFPGKPLALICGKPMIQWVYERVASVEDILETYVATDDKRICDAVLAFGGKAIMTGECKCGTERVFQAAKNLEADIILNIQGDEPLINAEMIEDLISCFEDESVEMATLKKLIDVSEEIDNPNVVKVITDIRQNAIYFSRYAIPFNRDGERRDYYKHIGVYGFRKNFLNKFVELPRGMYEQAESLEQLRAIEQGYKIRVKETMYQSVGVDCPEDINRVLEQIKKEGIV